MLLTLFELWDRRDSFVKTFSGGMKRRLEIARGLLHTPKILFLDEPTLGLDPQSRNQLWTHVKHLNETEGVTVFLTTHYMDEAERVAHRIAIIDHGKIVAQGTPQELKAADRNRFARGGVPDADRDRRSATSAPTRADQMRQMAQDVEAMTRDGDLHPLAARGEAVPAVARRRSSRRSAQPLLYLLVLGFGLGPVFQQAGQGSYLQFVAPGVIGMGDPVHVDLLRHRPAVGSAVRVPEGDAGRAGAAAAHHDRPHARRRDDRDDPGHARAGRLPDRRLPAAAVWRRCRWRSLFMALIAIVFAALGTAIGSTPEGHAGLSADHELPGDADLLPVGRAVPADQPADGADAWPRALDPLSYGIDGLRGALIGVSQFGFAHRRVVLSVVATAFLALGAWSFSRIQA